MKQIILIAALALSSCSQYTAEQRDWGFVKSVGGLEIGTPFLSDGEYYLPVNVDVSGLQRITVEPTLMNSGLMCSRMNHKILDDEIYISISTSLVGSAPEGGCESSPLFGIGDGEYKVFYQNLDESRVKLGKVVVGT